MQNKKNNKVGFRTYRKKMAAMLLVGMLAVSTAATRHFLQRTACALMAFFSSLVMPGAFRRAAESASSFASCKPPSQIVNAVKSRKTRPFQPLAVKNSRLNPNRQIHWQRLKTV